MSGGKCIFINRAQSIIIPSNESHEMGTPRSGLSKGPLERPWLGIGNYFPVQGPCFVRDFLFDLAGAAYAIMAKKETQ